MGGDSYGEFAGYTRYPGTTRDALICQDFPEKRRFPTSGYARGYVVFVVGNRLLMGDRRCPNADLRSKRFVLRTVNSGVRVLTLARIRCVIC